MYNLFIQSLLDRYNSKIKLFSDGSFYIWIPTTTKRIMKLRWALNKKKETSRLLDRLNNLLENKQIDLVRNYRGYL